MAVSGKSKKELIEENKALRSRLQELEQSRNECKKAKEESKKSKEFLDNVINTLDDPFFVKDQEHRWFMLNDAACKVMGRPRDELLGKSDYDLFPKEQADVFWEKDNLVLETGKTNINEEEITWHGKIHTISTKKSLFVDSVTSKRFVAGTIRDITERKRAEEAIRESEEKFRSLAEQSPNMIFINKEGKIVYANKRCEEIIGYKREEFYSPDFDFLDLIAPQSLDLIKENYRSHLEGREVPPYEYTIINKAGERIEAINSNKLIYYEGQTAILGIVTDITERKKSEESLRKSEELARACLNATNDMVYLVDKFNNILTVNDRAARRLGKTSDELIGKNILSYFTPDVAKSRKKYGDKVIRSGKNIRFQDEREGKFFDISVNPTFDSRGEVDRLAVFVTDITEQKKAQTALAESEQRFRKFFENEPEYCYMVSPEGIILEANRAALSTLGCVKEELVGKPVESIYAPESYKRLSQLFEQWKKTGEIRNKEMVIVTRNGERRNVLLSSTQVLSEDGEPLYSVSIQRDITDRKQAEEKLLDYQGKLKSLTSQLLVIEERERRRLAAELHDHIGQSLVMSKMKLDSLRKSLSPGVSTEILEDVCGCLKQVIRDTRTLTFDLSYPILYELGFEVAVAEWFDEQIREKHGLQTEFQDDGQPKPLDDDIKALLFRNVRELLINIIKHAKAHRVKVSIRRVDEHMHVSVEDDGVGFDPVEVTSTAAQKDKFGLFSIRERLEQLNGHIEIESERGRGSKITMTAPLNVEKKVQKE